MGNFTAVSSLHHRPQAPGTKATQRNARCHPRVIDARCLQRRSALHHLTPATVYGHGAQDFPIKLGSESLLHYTAVCTPLLRSSQTVAAGALLIPTSEKCLSLGQYVHPSPLHVACVVRVNHQAGDWQIQPFLPSSIIMGCGQEHCRQEDSPRQSRTKTLAALPLGTLNVDSGQPALHSPRDRLRPRVHRRRGPPVAPLDGGARTLRQPRKRRQDLPPEAFVDGPSSGMACGGPAHVAAAVVPVLSISYCWLEAKCPDSTAEQLRHIIETLQPHAQPVARVLPRHGRGNGLGLALPKGPRPFDASETPEAKPRRSVRRLRTT